MFYISNAQTENKKTFYEQLNQYLAGLMEGEPDWLANISNAAALLYTLMPTINWAGFYLYKGEELVLGPFQGKPACIRISLSRGVCGAAARERKVQRVEDVHAFPGHIACDEASQSEIVLPIINGDRLIGVLDIDSPVKGRFDEEDQAGLEAFVSILNERIRWPEF